MELTQGLRVIGMAPEIGASTSSAADGSAAVTLDALVSDYASLLFRVAFSILRNAAAAEDAVQDTFLRVLEHQAKLPTVRDIRPWLVRITWNLALDAKRRVAPEQADSAFLEALLAATPTAEQVLHDTQQAQSVLAAIDRLPRDERQALLLATVEEITVPEIAAAMRRSESAVRGLLFRARSHLRERLEKRATRKHGVQSEESASNPAPERKEP